MSYVSLISSFPHRELYRDIFMNDVDLPDDVYDYSKPKKLHINKQGRKKYTRHLFDDHGKVKADETSVFLDNGLELIVRRDFKKSISRKEYLELIKKSNSSGIRELIKTYSGKIDDFDGLPLTVQQAIAEIFDFSFPKEKRILSISPSGFLTEKVSLLNKFIAGISTLADWERAPEEDSVDDRLSKLSRYEWPSIPWVRRKDRKFAPIVSKDDENLIISEVRTYLFGNSVGVKVRRVFEKALHVELHEKYKSKRKKTLEFERSHRTLEMFEENKIDLLSCVANYDFYPVYLIAPGHSIGHNSDNRLFPYARVNTMEDIDPDIVHETQSVLSAHFPLQGLDSSHQTTSDSLGLSLFMRDIGRIRPHAQALSEDRFYRMAIDARNMAREEHDRMSLEFF